VSGQRKITSGPRLTPKQIVDAAVKVIGEGRAMRTEVETIVEQMTKQCERSKRTRSYHANPRSKNSLQSIQCGVAQGHNHDQKSAH
jgi:hypothetical protein